MKKLFLAALALVLMAPLGLATVSAAESWQRYTAGGLDTALARKDTLVVNVHADWCPTCRAQAPILDELRQDKRLKNVRFVRVDWDKDKDFVRRYRIPRQSTIVVFKNGKESARSIAETDRKRLRSFVFGAV